VDFRCYLPAFLALGLVRGLLSLEIHSERSTCYKDLRLYPEVERKWLLKGTEITQDTFGSLSATMHLSTFMKFNSVKVK
jgi:hypothetical protein